jgi:hypothetical protein
MLEYGSYERAEIYLTESISIKYDRAMPEDAGASFNYAENYRNLAAVRIAQGHFREAVQLTTRAIVLMENSYSAPRAAAQQSFRFHRAYAIYCSGDHDSALRAHEDVREVRIRPLGQDEVHTLNSYYACVVVLQAFDRLGEAE